MSTIVIERRLEVMPGNKIKVPGCEPTSTVTSTQMMAAMATEHLCKNSVVSLDKVLEAIPGSYIEFGDNFGAPRQKWLVLPPYDPEACPPNNGGDWFKVIQSIDEDSSVMAYGSCEVNPIDSCSFGIPKKQEGSPDTYMNEGDRNLYWLSGAHP